MNATADSPARRLPRDRDARDRDARDTAKSKDSAKEHRTRAPVHHVHHVHHKPAIPAAAELPGYTRLHICPFDADLAAVVLSTAIRPEARNLSFHTHQASPDRRFGFVELPTATADKLRRKLNGATLKGAKIQIETARKSGLAVYEEERAALTMGGKDKGERREAKKAKETNEEKKEKKEKKEKRDRKHKGRQELLDDVRAAGQEIVGVHLADGRSVKRGWTEPEDEAATKKRTYRSKEEKDQAKKDKKKHREASAYTEQPECLFKTVLPKAKTKAAKEETPADVDVDGEVDERAAKRQRRLEKKAREVVVHEFKNWTRIPNFIKSTGGASAAPNLEYVDGQGWVDTGSGTVVEALAATRPAEVKAVMTADEQRAKRAKYEAMQAERRMEGEGEASESDTSETSDSDTSSDGSDSDDDVADTDKDDEMADKDKKAANLTIQIPPAAPATPAKVHPLEALYKRAAASGSADAPVEAESAGFSFFGAGDDDDIDMDDAGDHMVDADGAPADDTAAQPPMTPFSTKEIEWRSTRSAAPTPDTAHPSRIRFWGHDDDDADADDDDDDDNDDKNDDDGPAEASPVKKADASTDFAAWFWENRGDLNRSWKRRRKTAAKEKRYRENRARNERAI